MASINTSIGQGRFFELLIFTLFKSGFCLILKINFLSLLATALKLLKRCRQQLFKFFKCH
jgi:hypothetical protein